MYNSLWIVEIVSLFCRFLFMYNISSFMELRLAIQVPHVRKCWNHFYFSIFFKISLYWNTFRLKLEEQRCIVKKCTLEFNVRYSNKCCHWVTWSSPNTQLCRYIEVVVGLQYLSMCWICSVTLVGFCMQNGNANQGRP